MGDSMKDLKGMTTKKIWTEPVIKVIELSAAKGGSTGSADIVPGGRS
jgi:hypothetical protein